MDFSKIKNKLLICLCCVVLILPFYLITFTYATESGDTIVPEIVEGLSCNANSNYFTSGARVTVYPVRVGYYYTITNIDDTFYRGSVYSSEYPELNGTYIFLYNFSPEGDKTFNYQPSTNGYVTLNGTATEHYIVTEYKITGMNSTISELVDNVGINSIWNIFDISVNYIIVVVLFAFGCYIIFRVIKKVSRGKEGL